MNHPWNNQTNKRMDSRCAVLQNNGNATTYEGTCTKMTCNTWDSGTKKYVSVTLNFKDGSNVECTQADGKQSTVKTVVGTVKVTCPLVDVVCDIEKPFDCLFGYSKDGSCICRPGDLYLFLFLFLPFPFSFFRPFECTSPRPPGYKGTTCDTQDDDDIKTLTLYTGTTQAPTIPTSFCMAGSTGEFKASLNQAFTKKTDASIGDLTSTTTKTIFNYVYDSGRCGSILWYNGWYHMWVISDKIYSATVLSASKNHLIAYCWSGQVDSLSLSFSLPSLLSPFL